ncbi:adhesion G protein-coupled receptor F5-like [Scomber japonicus]|uniref:adhesion G protein-coupled receptor F5-like n=1 Tax=Scomber japonicus TaxID=13676 RepID=UPI002305BF2C|nr:adhesion G protein-coupled receptor F5-like [Scomber japonicus]
MGSQRDRPDNTLRQGSQATRVSQKTRTQRLPESYFKPRGLLTPFKSSDLEGQGERDREEEWLAKEDHSNHPGEPTVAESSEDDEFDVESDIGGLDNRPERREWMDSEPESGEDYLVSIFNNTCYNKHEHSSSYHNTTNSYDKLNTYCYNTPEHYNTHNFTNNCIHESNSCCYNTYEHYDSFNTDNTDYTFNNSSYNRYEHIKSHHTTNNSQSTTVSSTTEATSIPAVTTTLITTTIPTTTTATTTTTIDAFTTAVIPITIGRSTTTALPSATTSPAPVTGFDVAMSIRLEKDFTEDLNDATSSAYQDLKTSIEPVLRNQYKVITGFIDASVTGFSRGSIITNYVVQTSQVNPAEIAEANKNITKAMEPIAPVIGSVTAVYSSSSSINVPRLTYTGGQMILTCGPLNEDFNMGRISRSVWKFKGSKIAGGRYTITTSNIKSTLRIDNVIPADAGFYECTLVGEVMEFFQNGTVKAADIKLAPIVRLQSKINVECSEGLEQPLKCCVQSNYRVKWFSTNLLNSDTNTEPDSYCIIYKHVINSCTVSEQELRFTCRVDEPSGYQMTTTMIIFRGTAECDDAQYGKGREGDKSTIQCEEGQEGSKTAVCRGGVWTLEADNCIVSKIKEILIESVNLNPVEVPQFVEDLNTAVQSEQTEIADSSATISAIVDIINSVANVSTTVDEVVMTNILTTVDAIIGDDAKESWDTLNENEIGSASSKLLGSLEALSEDVVGEFSITTPRIQLNRTSFNNAFKEELNSSVVIDIPDTNTNNISITTIIFSTLHNVMPARNSSYDPSLFNATNNQSVPANAINAAVVLVRTSVKIQNVTMSFDKQNNSLILNPQCVFWNFTLFKDQGAWDDEGCTFISDINNTVTCNCNHLTSFSILMATDIPPSLRQVLDVITYVGVGISMASLVICLIIEGYVWKAMTRNSTAFMRHVSIVNTALSLLIANICFIISAAIVKNPLENPGEDYTVPVGQCSTATFFMHFFYLALFFWMLVSGLLLFYRTVMVFSHMSKSTMLAIGFTVGYVCPLIIAVITVAVTAPGNGYIRTSDACWLNWSKTKALLALVIPALTIVVINILIVIVVLFKMLRRGMGDVSQADEKHTLVVIARCLIILTPLFGLTWSLGVGTMVSSTNKGIHIAFAFFNSLQGFFILVFGTLLDSKIRSRLSRTLPTSSTGSNPTRSTSAGISSLGGMNLISRLRGRRYMYNVSGAANRSSSNEQSESFVSI